MGALLLVGVVYLATPALFAEAGSAEYARSRDQLFAVCLIGFLLFIVLISYLWGRRRQSSETPQRNLRWVGPLMLAGLVYLTADAILAEANAEDYARRHGRLFNVCLLAFLLFVVRVTNRATPSLLKAARSADQKSEYLRGGWMAVDLFLLLSAVAAVFVLDWGGWRDYVVQIGVVSALVVVRIVVSLVQRALERSDRTRRGEGGHRSWDAAGSGCRRRRGRRDAHSARRTRAERFAAMGIACRAAV